MAGHWLCYSAVSGKWAAESSKQAGKAARNDCPWHKVCSPAVRSQVGRDCQRVHPHSAGDVARARPGDSDAHDAKDTVLGIVGGQAQGQLAGAVAQEFSILQAENRSRQRTVHMSCPERSCPAAVRLEAQHQAGVEGHSLCLAKSVPSWAQQLHCMWPQGPGTLSQ